MSSAATPKTGVRLEPDTSFTQEQLHAFQRDGFLIVEEGLVSEAALERLRERYVRLFDGEYETGISPDEVNWVPGRDPEDRTRQLCNAWKADNVVAAQVLSERTGRLAAQLAGYRGVRILQDNVLWKPPGTKAIGFHQDSSYADYLVPAEMVTCWISLHETQADAGPLEFVRGSHMWPKSPRHVRTSTRRRTGSRVPAPPHPPATSPRRCPSSSSPAAARSTTA